MKRLKIILILLLTAGILSGQNKNKEILNCSKCHECAIPTKDNPCLKKCPRELMNIVYHMPISIPKVLIIDNFKSEPNHYPPVKFSHQTHAEMSAMSGSCQMCHHYNPVGAIIGCKECHEIERKRTDLTKIDLKGAYHVQCMNCHRSWSNQIECNTCHNQSDKKDKNTPGKQVHSQVNKPVVKVYETQYAKGKLVTFYHDEHTNKFGFECSSCHTDQGCIQCHKKMNGTPVKKFTLNEMHNKCSRCHNVQDNCAKCHMDKKKNPFDHYTRTGWQLNQFHAKLACLKCHIEKGKFAKLNNECSACHAKWTSANFKHGITGLILNETHAANDCENCHIDKNYKNPVCTNCHEAAYKYPDKKPGTLVKKKA